MKEKETKRTPGDPDSCQAETCEGCKHIDACADNIDDKKLTEDIIEILKTPGRSEDCPFVMNIDICPKCAHLEGACGEQVLKELEEAKKRFSGEFEYTEEELEAQLLEIYRKAAEKE